MSTERQFQGTFAKPHAGMQTTQSPEAANPEAGSSTTTELAEQAEAAARRAAEKAQAEAQPQAQRSK